MLRNAWQSIRRGILNDHVLAVAAPETAARITANGTEEDVTVEALQPGDRVRIRPGQRVPVDSVT